MQIILFVQVETVEVEGSYDKVDIKAPIPKMGKKKRE